jgi:cytochrome c553
MFRPALAIASILGLCAAPLSADCRRIVRVQQVVAVAEVVPVVAAVYAPVAVAAYSVGYGNNGGDLVTENLRLKIELLEQRLSIVQAQQRPNGQATPDVPPTKTAPAPQVSAATMLFKKCASCHNSESAKAKGDGFVLFDNGVDGQARLAKLSDAQALKVISETFSGRMPKNGKPLTDEEVSQVMALFDTRAALGK